MYVVHFVLCAVFTFLGNMLKINFLKFFPKFPVFDFASKNSMSWKLLRIFH